MQNFTIEEYKKELDYYHSKGGKLDVYPSPTDSSDPLYLKKFAHNIPPLDAYKLKPP